MPIHAVLFFRKKGYDETILAGEMDWGRALMESRIRLAGLTRKLELERWRFG